MKRFLKVIWVIFAVIGILFAAYYIGLRLTYGRFYISIHQKYDARIDEYVELLRTAEPLGKDTTTFEMKILQDSVRAREIRDYFNLDSLCDADADTWTRRSPSASSWSDAARAAPPPTSSRIWQRATWRYPSV